MRLHVTDLHASYTVVEPFTLPYHSGSLLRGVLGRALRRTGCLEAADTCAAACQHPGACVYTRFFDPLRRFVRGLTRAPSRLIPLLPPMRSVDLAAGDVDGLTLQEMALRSRPLVRRCALHQHALSRSAVGICREVSAAS